MYDFRLARWLLMGILLVPGIVFASPDIPPPPAPPGEQPAAEVDADREAVMPDAGFLRDFRQARSDSRAIELGIAEAPSVPSVGEALIPVLCVRFLDTSRPPFPVEAYGTLLFNDPPAPSASDGPPPRTMTQYYRDMSLGNFNVSGRVFGWLDLPGKAAEYEEDVDHDGSPSDELGALIHDALAAADPHVDFSDFDSNDDGKADLVILIHARPSGQSKRGKINSQYVRYDEDRFQRDPAGPFQTDDARVTEVGNVVVSDVVIVAGVEPPIAEDGADRLPTIGVFCHEFAHALGLPDLYDRTPRRLRVDSRGVGMWCLMSSGLYAGCPEGAQPIALSAWGKARLGWADVRTIDPGRVESIAIEPVGLTNQVYRVDVPGTGGREYFLAEYRDPTWSPPPRLRRVNWDQCLPADPGGGLAIWHVDETVGDPPRPGYEWPFAYFDEGQNDRAWLEQSPVNGRNHPLVRLVQADGQFALENNTGYGDPSDLWALAAGGRFEPKGYHGGDAGLRLVIADGAVTVQAEPAEAGEPVALAAADTPRERPAAEDLATDAAPPAPRDDEARTFPAPDPAPVDLPAGEVRARRAYRPFPGRPVLPAPAREDPRAEDPSPAQPTAEAGEDGPRTEDAAALEYLDRQVLISGKGILDRPEVLDLMRELPGGLLESTVSPTNLPTFTKAAQQARTRDVEVSSTVSRYVARQEMATRYMTIDGQRVPVIVPRSVVETVRESVPAPPPEDDLERAIQKWVRDKKGGEKVILRTDESNEHAELISGFSIPRAMDSIVEDAERSLDTLAPILGNDPVAMRRKGVEETAGGYDVVGFEAVYNVPNVRAAFGESLPIFNAETQLYYEKGSGEFAAVTSRPIRPSEIELTVDEPRVSPEQAAETASRLLDPGTKLSAPPRLGIYCVDDDPGRARLAYEAVATAAPGREPQRIYLDAVSGKLLKLR